MNNAILIELFGYLGSLLVVVSMLMKSVKKLRIINTIGSVIFMTYAIIIRSYPTAFMNLCLVIINIYNIIQLGREDKHYNVLSTAPASDMVRYFLQRYEEDIMHFFPDVTMEMLSKCEKAYMVTCDTTPAGLLIGDEKEAGVLEIQIDYATPTYRDSSVGEYLYRQLPEHGIQKLMIREGTEAHTKYIKEVGFVRSGAGYEKDLTL